VNRIALKNTLFSLLLSLTTTSCFKVEGEKQSSGGSATVTATTPTKWSASALGASGLNFKISDDIENGFVAGDLVGGLNPVEQMMKAWNDTSSSISYFDLSAPQAVNKQYGTYQEYLNDSEFGVYRSDSWVSGVSSQALAITAYKAFPRNAGTSSYHLEIVHADVIMNYRDYDFTMDSNDNLRYDFHSVVLHELGHALGLKHVESFSTNSVMYKYLGRSDVQRSPTTYDDNTVSSLYGVSSSLAAAAVVKDIPTQYELPSDARRNEDGSVTGLIELRADGECRHYLGDKLTHSHKVSHNH